MVAIIFAVLLLSSIFVFKYVIKGTTNLKKKFTTAFDTYIRNLGFTPSNSYIIDAPVIFPVVSKKDEIKFASIVAMPNVSYNMDYRPKIGLFLDSKQKLFAVRTWAEEINPKVYKFSQLQSCEMTQDVRESMRGAIYSHGIALGFGGKTLAGDLTLRVVCSGENGPEAVTLHALINNLKRTTGTAYQQRLEELKQIVDCLYWIQDNA